MFRSLFNLLKKSTPINEPSVPTAPINNSPFAIGASVRTKAGFKDPDNGDDIGGWQGRVRKVDMENSIIVIDWDSITLKGMDEGYISECVKQGLGWESMHLGFDDPRRCRCR